MKEYKNGLTAGVSDQECHSFDVWLNGFEMLSVVYGGFQIVTYK